MEIQNTQSKIIKKEFFTKKITVFIEIAVLILFLVGAYYLYTTFSEQETVTTQAQINQQLLGKNFVLFLKAMNQDKISLRDVSFLEQPLVSQLKDFSETILPSSSRGRDDPFTPYASTRLIR